jgi:polysaccharide pyruvyl transferase CsaB
VVGRTPPSSVPLPPSSTPGPCRPLLVGYYGEHNLGDDALLEVLLQQLPAEAEPIVTARDQQLVVRSFGVACVDRGSLPQVLAALGSAQALVLGGGSLLQDSTSFGSLLYYGALILAARWQGKPVLLWAQGLGPLRRRRSRLLVRTLLACPTACSWRDAASAALARQLGWSPAAGQLPQVDGEPGVGADPVWTLPPVPWRGKGGPVLLCFRPTAQLQGEAWRPWLAALARLVPERELIWVAFHAGQDRGLLQQLRSEGQLSPELDRRSRELRPPTPAAAIELFAGSGLVLAMRLHGLILAAVGGAPVAALSYDPKVQAAARALGCPVHDLGASTSPEQLLQTWQGCLDQPVPAEHLARLRQGGESHAQLFDALKA